MGCPEDHGAGGHLEDHRAGGRLEDLGVRAGGAVHHSSLRIHL